MGIVCQAEPARTLALDEREHVAQAAVERLTRRTTIAGGELAWAPALFDAKNLQPSLKKGETSLDWFSTGPARLIKHEFD